MLNLNLASYDSWVVGPLGTKAQERVFGPRATEVCWGKGKPGSGLGCFWMWARVEG